MKETYILVFVLSFPTMLLQILDLLSVVAFFVALIDSLLADFANLSLLSNQQHSRRVVSCFQLFSKQSSVFLYWLT
jgi:hypothetical protein